MEGATDSRGMSSMNAIDTNVLVYAHDADEPTKQAKATSLLNQLVQNPFETMLLWQVAGELLSCLRKWESAGKISANDVEANFRDVLAMFPLRIPTVDVFDVSFGLRSRFSLSHWTAFSSLLARCTASPHCIQRISTRERTTTG